MGGSAPPAVVSSWTGWGSASSKAQTCGSPRTWISNPGRSSPVVSVAQGEENHALGVCHPSGHQGHVLSDSWPEPPTAQTSTFPSPDDTTPLGHGRSGPRALPWDRTQEVALQVGDLSSVILGDSVPHVLQGTWGQWLEPLSSEKHFSFYVKTTALYFQRNRKKRRQHPLCRDQHSNRPVPLTALQVAVRAFVVSPRWESVGGRRRAHCGRAKCPSKRGLCSGLSCRPKRVLWSQNVCKGRRCSLRDRTA